MSAPAILLLGLLIWWAAYSIYRFQVRPMILGALSDWIRRIHDGLEMNAIEDSRIAREPGFKSVLARAEKAQAHLHAINIAALCTHEVDALTKAEVAEQDEQIGASSKTVRDANQNVFLAILAAVLVNGPFLGVAILTAGVIMYWRESVKKKIDSFATAAWGFSNERPSRKFSHA